MRFAAIDLGTVTCRLLVADVSEQGKGQPFPEASGMHIVPLAKEYAIVNLGEGVDETHRLSPQALMRTREALLRFLDTRDELDTPEDPLVGTACVATSASRDAENSAELEALFAELGLHVQVITGEREAALTFSGVGSAFPHEDLIVVDVGGGSTEVIFGSTGNGVAPASHGSANGSNDISPASKVRSVHSYDIGSRRITERFFQSDPPSPDEIARARAYIRKALISSSQSEKVKAALSEEQAMPIRLVAVAGTATSVVSIREHMEVYDSARVHGAAVTADELAAILEGLASIPLIQRKRIAGLDPGRAPVIVAGLVILQEVMQLYRRTSFTVSESDILSGIIISEYEEALIRLPE